MAALQPDLKCGIRKSLNDFSLDFDKFFIHKILPANTAGIYAPERSFASVIFGIEKQKEAVIASGITIGHTF